MGAEQLESSSAEKDLGILADTKVNLGQQRVLAAKKARVILRCVRQSIGSRSRDVILPLCSALERPQRECWVQFWAPQDERDVDILERVCQRAPKVVKRL